MDKNKKDQRDRSWNEFIERIIGIEINPEGNDAKNPFEISHEGCQELIKRRTEGKELTEIEKGCLSYHLQNCTSCKIPKDFF